MRLSTFAAILTVTVCMLFGGTAAYSYATTNVTVSSSAPTLASERLSTETLTGEDRYALALWQHGIPASEVEKSTVAVYGAAAGLILGMILAFPIHVSIDTLVQRRTRRRYRARAAY